MTLIAKPALWLGADIVTIAEYAGDCQVAVLFCPALFRYICLLGTDLLMVPKGDICVK